MSGFWFLFGAVFGFMVGSLCQWLLLWLFKQALKEAKAMGWTVRQFLEFWEGNSQPENREVDMTILMFFKRLLRLDKAVFPCGCGEEINLVVPLRKRTISRQCKCSRHWCFAWRGDRWDVGHTNQPIRLTTPARAARSYADMVPLDSVAGTFTPDPEDITNPQMGSPRPSRLAEMMSDKFRDGL